MKIWIAVVFLPCGVNWPTKSYESLSFLWTRGFIYYFTQKYTSQVDEVKKMLIAAGDSRLISPRGVQTLVLVPGGDSTETDWLVKYWSWWICEEQAAMGRWKVTQKQQQEWTKEIESCFKKTAAGWQADCVGVMLCCRIDETSWYLNR